MIRPLIFLPEKYAPSVAKRLELPIRKPNCPVAGHTKREEMKDIIRYFTKLMPDADERIMNAIADTHWNTACGTGSSCPHGTTSLSE